MHLNPLKIRHLHNAIDQNTISELYNLATIANKSLAHVGNLENNQYVKSYDSNICNAYLVDYSNFIDKVENLIDTCKTIVKEKTKLKCINTEINFLYYNNGGKYWPHIDGQAFINENTLSRGNKNRDITCVVYLNNEYSGGEIYFPFFDLKYNPKACDIMLYPCDFPYMHGVTEVTGLRYAIVLLFETDIPAYSKQDVVITDSQILKTLYSIK